MRRPFFVDFISSREDAAGEVVPMPAAPLDGNVFCENVLLMNKAKKSE